MGAVAKISVKVAEELARDIDAAVASGDYADTDDVVNEALVAWRAHREAELARLRAAVEEGLASGESQPFTREVMNELLAEAKASAAKRRAA